MRRVLFIAAFTLPPFSAFSSLLVCLVLGVSAGLQARLQPYCQAFENNLEMASFLLMLLLLLLTNHVVRLKGQVLGTVDGDAVGATLFTANLLFVVVVASLLLRKGVQSLARRASWPRSKVPREVDVQLLADGDS